MHEFLVTATSPSGVRETNRVKATDSQGAYAALEARGYCDIVLHSDDAGVVGTSALRRMNSTPRTVEQLPPEDEVLMRGFSNFRFFIFYLKKLYFRPSLLLFVIGFIVMGWISSTPGFYYKVAALWLFVPAFIAAWSVFFGTSTKFKKLTDAFAWGRWEEVLTRCSKLSGKVPEFELTARAACALAGLGRLEEAKAMWEPYSQSDEIPHWMYLARLAEIFEVAQFHEESLNNQALAYQEDPENPSLQLDYAMALLKNERDLKLAQELIAKAEKQQLSDLLQMILPYIKGLAAFNSGKYALAVERFEAARKALLPLADGEPLIGLVIDVVQANLAIALAKNGRTKRAFEEAERPRIRLRARNSAKLLKRLDNAIGSV